jgi:L-lactate dehydrogenase
MTTNIASESLTSFGRDLFRASGMDEEKAATVARLLVLGDMMGRQTHGMALAPLYLDQLEKKMMQPTGEQVCIKDTVQPYREGNYSPGLAGGRGIVLAGVESMAS